MTMEVRKIPIGLIETILNSKHTADLMVGGNTHMPALHLVGEAVKHTDDANWIAEIIKGALPLDYGGNTLKEIPQMVKDSIQKGFANAPTTKSKHASASETTLKLVDLAGMELFHTAQHVGFASMKQSGQGVVSFPVRSEAMKGFIRLAYHQNTGKMIGRDQVAEVIDLLDAKAVYTAPERQVHVRIGSDGENIFYDLGSSDSTIVKITPFGWHLVQESPIPFYRPAGFSEQVAPVKGGKLSDLRDLLQLDDKNWITLLAFLLAALRPAHPYPALLVSGGQGSGKSKVSELIKRIVDPGSPEKLRLPKDEHTLAIQASQSRLMAYDNTSSMKLEMSDALCAMLTGGGFSTRKFYADDEQRMFKNARPVVMNGIGEFANQHDLLDRSMVMKLPRISDGQRLTEKAINARFEDMLPGILGALFYVIGTALRRFNHVEPPTSIRMADVAQWLMACEPACELPDGTFLRSMEASVNEVTIDNTLNHPLVLAIFRLLPVMGEKRAYEGTVGDLHEKLKGEYGRLDPHLPQTASHLSNVLQRLAPGMAKIGLMVDMQTRTNKARKLRIWVEPNEYTPEANPISAKLS